ncbi:hypothetical protein GCM10010402_66490 [Actinomadura luteofluorescens]|uniref:helix-turn-helix domain-containing protein n=1 Tax=Actinomadura luteofluorescens TaxID=46163 RepID=UPI0021644825|nr:helix-turn-helix transcriptional regulator [Actinomadura glauciflava]MCR3744180.1 Helix-turn-helix domain-containing protein [Actinomadura glauciflava]
MASEDRRDRLARAGAWLRDQREQRGITSQAELARRLGWDRSLVSNYEIGKTEMPDDRAEQLAEFLGLDIITVRRGLGLWVPRSDPRRSPDMDEAEAMLDENERLAAEIRSLAERDRAAVTAVIEALKQNSESGPNPGNSRR